MILFGIAKAFNVVEGNFYTGNDGLEPIFCAMSLRNAHSRTLSRRPTVAESINALSLK